MTDTFIFLIFTILTSGLYSQLFINRYRHQILGLLIDRHLYL